MIDCFQAINHNKDIGKYEWYWHFLTSFQNWEGKEEGQTENNAKDKPENKEKEDNDILG